MNATKLAIIGGFVAIVGIGIGASILYERRRKDRLARAAADLGFTFEPQGTPRCRSVDGVVLFARGRSQRTRNVMVGAIEDIDVELFDYRYTTGSGKNSSNYHQTVCAMRVPGRNLPRFDLRREGVMHRVAASFGNQDIDFESHPEFSKTHLLRGPDEEAIRALFTDARITRLEGLDGKLVVEGAADWILVYRHRRRAKPEELSELLSTAFDVSGVFG